MKAEPLKNKGVIHPEALDLTFGQVFRGQDIASAVAWLKAQLEEELCGVDEVITPVFKKVDEAFEDLKEEKPVN